MRQVMSWRFLRSGSCVLRPRSSSSRRLPRCIYASVGSSRSPRAAWYERPTLGCCGLRCAQCAARSCAPAAVPRTPCCSPLACAQPAHALARSAPPMGHRHAFLRIEQRRTGDGYIDQQTTTALHQCVCPKAERRWLAAARAHELCLRLIGHAGKESLRDLVLDEPAPVLPKTRVFKRSLLHVQEPAEQHVVVQHLANQPVRALRIQRDQQRRLEQALRHNRRRPVRLVHRIELRTHRSHYHIALRLDPKQRMIGCNQVLDREVTEQSALPINVAAHSSSFSYHASTVTIHHTHCSRCFSTPC